jgi:hypothetical protein
MNTVGTAITGQDIAWKAVDINRRALLLGVFLFNSKINIENAIKVSTSYASSSCSSLGPNMHP